MDFEKQIVEVLKKETGLKEINLEIPPSSDLGDFAFPCFVLSKEKKKSPIIIAQELANSIKKPNFISKIIANGPYLNFFLDKNQLTKKVLFNILKKGPSYGSSQIGKNKKIIIDMSSPNIAKPFGIGHLRSTIIGNSIANISSFIGYKTIKINYLGDWGTQFGKLIVAYKKWGNNKKLKSSPIKYLQELYVKINAIPELEEDARKEFKKLEEGDKENLKLWKEFKELSLTEFNRIYNLLGITFDVVSGESFYNNKMNDTLNLLEKKKLLEKSEGAKIVNLEKYNLGVCLIKKSDGATLYATRDITAAQERYKKYKFNKMIYETGAEQNLHFNQFFKVLELLGYSWAKNCIHISHGLYLDKDGKKFSTRKGKTIYMSDIINETIDLAKKEIQKREKQPKIGVEKRANNIAIAAIIYGDLKNYREHDIIFDIDRFISFEGNTGPYLLYSYARAKNILRKSKNKKKRYNYESINSIEQQLINKLSLFPEIIINAYNNLSPNIIANYAHELSQKFNEFYHANKVIGSKEESFRLALVEAFSIVLKNSLSLLGINVIEKM